MKAESITPAARRPDSGVLSVAGLVALTTSPAFLAILLFGIALGFRTAGLADFVTTDEAYHWIRRTERFSAAIAAQEWDKTRLTGHPGVTLMWLGSLGLALERLATSMGAGSATEVQYLAWLRLPTAVLQSILIIPGYLLLRRLVLPLSALIAALLWATAPFLIAHARLLHLDALLTAFVTLSLLCVLISSRSEHPMRWLIGGGVWAGLALLTKGPALILLPVSGLLLLWQVPVHTLGERLRSSIGHYLVWLGNAALVVLLLWPALWVVPGRAFDKYVTEIIDNGGRPNGAGQFFLGATVDDPGPLFYLVADVFRMTPLTTLGLLLLPLALWRSPRERGVLLALGAFVGFWTLVMTLGPKKFDRYVLPTWPALLVLAAAGLRVLLVEGHSLLARMQLPPLVRRSLVVLVGVLLLAVALQPAVTYHPYYLSYYNPLVGVGRAAQHNLLIGWGEGMDQVGAYLRSRPDLDDGPVLTALPRTLRPFVPVPVKNVHELNKDTQNYAVVYRESLQRGAHPAIYQEIQQTVPIQQITIHGIDYALIYQLPRAFEQPVGTSFGTHLHLWGVTIDRQADQITVTPAWDVRGEPAADYYLFLHLLDAQGRRVAQVDVAPGGSDWPATSAWEPGQQIAVPIPLPLPASLPPGDYRLMMGLYDLATGTRVPLAQAPNKPALAQDNALVLDTLRLP